MKLLDKQHYAYMKINRTSVGYDRDEYDVDTIDYLTFDTLEAVAEHYKNRDKYSTGSYFKMIPLKFDVQVTVNVKE